MNKQETLEEAAENYSTIICDKQERLLGLEYNAKEVIKDNTKDDFIAGVKWKQERSYSEEEVLELFKTWNNFPYSMSPRFEVWFEQFKKK